jgi:hypothetical protein
MIILLSMIGIIILYQLVKIDIPIRVLITGKFKAIKYLYVKHHFVFKAKYQFFMYLLLSICSIVIGLVFYLPISLIATIVGFCWASYPVLVLWQLQHRYHANEFEQITSFLQHFIAHFKSNSKVLLALYETKSYLSGKMLKLVEEAIGDLELNGNANDAFARITKEYPHFIVWNIQTWITSAELYGVDDCKEAVELLEDDIDDWIEDTQMHILSMYQMKNKILLLSIIAIMIALFNQRMLSSFMDLTSQTVYHHVVFIFLLSILFTILMAYRFLRQSWIVKGECLWKESS